MEIKIVKGDITKIKIEAIVNAANETLSGGGGVDSAIHRAAGPGLTEECAKLKTCHTGEAKITGCYNLSAKYVIHTVGPVYGEGAGREAELLADSYKNCLKLAKEKGIRSIAFPAISTGAYGYPKDEAAWIAISAVKEFISQNPESLDEIIFVLIDSQNYDIYQKLLTANQRNGKK